MRGILIMGILTDTPTEVDWLSLQPIIWKSWTFRPWHIFLDLLSWWFFFWSLPRSKVYESPLGRICVFFQASYSASPSVKSGSINFRTWSFTALTKESISKNKTGYQHPRYQHDLGCQNGLTRKYWADDHTRSGSSSYTIRGEIAPATHVYTLGHL